MASISTQVQIFIFPTVSGGSKKLWPRFILPNFMHLVERLKQRSSHLERCLEDKTWIGVSRQLFNSEMGITLWKCLFLHQLLGRINQNVNQAPLQQIGCFRTQTICSRNMLHSSGWKQPPKIPLPLLTSALVSTPFSLLYWLCLLSCIGSLRN